jgi:hypothetical protein
MRDRSRIQDATREEEEELPGTLPRAGRSHHLPYAQRREKEMAWRGRPAGRASTGAGCSAPAADPLARAYGGASSLHERRGELLHPGRSA